MRANVRSKSIIALSLIFLLAILLFSAVFSVDVAAADSATYLSAEVTLSSGEFLPSGFVYDNSAVSLDFIVYKSADQIAWVADGSFSSKFELRYHDDLADADLPSAPFAVGSYSVSVVAKDSSLSGFYFGDLQPVVTGSVIGTSSFTIYSQNLYLYNSVLDAAPLTGDTIRGAGEILLPDTGSFDYFTSVSDGTALYLGGVAVPSEKYSVAVEYMSGLAFVPVSEIDKVGTYRLKVTIDSAVDLSMSEAADSLEKSGDDHVYYRVFSVTCETLSFALDSFSVYSDASRDVKLNAASMTKLTNIAGTQYDTVLLYYPSSDGVARVIAADGSDDDLYHPTEVGTYAYRVIFKVAVAKYGIAIGDYVDVAFSVIPVPYVIRYYNNEDTEITKDTIIYSGSSAYPLHPVFFDLDGYEIGSVYDNVGSPKYSVSYMSYNGASWSAVDAPSGAGLYKLLIHFNTSATVGTYTIPTDPEPYLFRIVGGTLEVDTSERNYYLPIGEASIPSFTFKSQAGDESANVGAYTVNYFDKKGASLGTAAPTDVGEYVYELRMTNAITSLGVEAGATYRGSYSIIYRPMEVVVEDTVTFRDALTHSTLMSSALSADFDIAYFEKSGNIYKALGSTAPTVEGQYAMRLVAKRALDKYRVAVGDEYVYAYSIAGSETSVVINTPLDLTYDGGVKVPNVSFLNDSTSVELTPLLDYQVAYYRLTGSVYLPCDAPILAGNYRCVVTFLQDDPLRGMVAGAYARTTFVIAPAQYGVVFTVSDDSYDLVYDGRDKTYDVAFTYKSRPINVASSVKYATSSGAFGDDAYKNVGQYRAKVLLDDDKSGSLIVQGETISFSIVPLTVTAIFKVPLGYNRMWVDDDTIVAPTVEYLCGNGRFEGESLTADVLAAAPYSIAFDEIKTYHCSENKGISYDILKEPKTPGEYKETVTLDNANISIVAVQSVGDNNGVVYDPALVAGAASQRFTVTPREVLVRYTYDAEKDSIYYTEDDPGVERTLDRKGVKDDGIEFYAYTKGTQDYTTDVSAAFAGDFKVYYLISGSSGVVQPGAALSEEKPYEKGYYVARVRMEPTDENKAYLSRYTFKNGMNADGAIGESSLKAGCYVDDVFHIKDQNKIDVVFNMPTTFADDGNFKTISAVFYNNFATVDFVQGVGEDYAISYFRKDNEGNIIETNTTSYKDVGTYYFRITFLKDNVAYRLESYAGEYSGSDNIYIKNGDTITYEFTIFDKRSMNVSFAAPASLYYDNQSKAYSVRFSVIEDDLDCTVTLTEGTHYSIRYYSVDSGVYTVLNSAPVDPGSYVVEAVFLRDLLDYTYEDTGETVLADKFYSVVDSANPPAGKIVAPNTSFTIEKAVLLVGGITAKDKSFDNTKTASFDERSRTLTTKYGVNVKGLKASELTGSLKGTFVSKYPGTHDVTLADDGKYAFPQDGYDYSKYYELEYASFSATIEKAVIYVRLTDGVSVHEGSTVLVSREYNPFAIESTIKFTLEYDEDFLSEVFSSALDFSIITVGSLSYEKNAEVGNVAKKYPIVMNTLQLNDAAVGEAYTGPALSELFYLDLEKECYYEITPRAITLAVSAGQEKVYGDEDPESFEVTITSGRLIYGDTIKYKVVRRSGENYGAYLIELSEVKVYNSTGYDVSANYTITLKTDYFHILKRELLIVPENQSATYKQGFSYSGSVKISDVTRSEDGVDVTAAFLSNPPVGHDRLTGKLSYVATDDSLKFLITQGSMSSVVNALGRDVTNNYVIRFDTTPKYYTITQVNIEVKLRENATLQKYYGDKEPIIAYDIDEAVLATIKGLTIASNSSVGREAGETVGTYYLKSDNSMRSFFVYDEGIDVTDYFTFTVKRLEENTWRIVHDDVFTILPRPIIVTVEEATYEYTGREILPELKYLNANGSRLSATLRDDLAAKVNIALPEGLKLVDGENMVTPVIVGESNPNYQINLQAGKINVIYLQNVLTVTPLDESDEIYKGNEYIFSGIMLYKSVKFYKIDTASGEQPSRELSISLPVDENVTGDGLVVVALRQNGSSKAFSFTQVGQTIVYEDDGAYYVAIAEVQEWFYAIWGITIILALVAIYYLIRLIIFLVKRHKKKAAAAGPKPKKEKKKKKGAAPAGAFTPTGNVQAEPTATEQPAATAADTDSLFSDTAVTDTAPVTAAPAAPAETADATVNADDLFTDVAPTEAADVGVTPTTTTAVDDARSDAANDLFTEHPMTDDALTAEAPAPAEEAEAEDPKPKKKKDKKEKTEKKDKKEKKGKSDQTEDANAPKGFMPKGFKPKGDKSSVYAPTRSFTEDLFNEETSDNGDSLLSDNAISDNAVITPPTAPTSGADDDELIVSRGGGFSFEDDVDENDPEGKKKKKDDDQD